MAPPKLAEAVVPVTLLALLGVVAGQISYAPSTSPSATPPSLRPVRPNQISYPPNPSPSSSIPPTYPPNPSQPAYSPSPSPLRRLIPPTYPSSNSPLSSISIPPTYPPSAKPLINPSISISPTIYTPITINPPSASPSLSISNPPTYSPSARPGPSPSTTSPPTSPSPSPSPSSLILIPPTISPSASPSPSISSPPTYSPSASLGPSPLITSPPASPSPSPSSSISIPPTTSPSASPNPSISSPPTYPPSASLSPSPSISASPSPSPSSSISIPPTSPPSLSPSSTPSGLRVDYYKYLCPKAETVVRKAVKSAIDSNRGTGAGLIRLFFHDCFVQGCDASVLLNTTVADSSGETTERASAPNLSLRGFEVIDAAKDELEKECPDVVSCADIVAFAGRDATFFLSGGANNNAAVVDFDMPAGRYDGRVSLDSEALANLPPPFASLQQLRDMFAGKGLDTEDMVTLSGAHTVGRSHCSSFSDRLPPHAAGSEDNMNATFSAALASQCRNGGGGGGDTAVVPQDWVTPDDLDSQYYRNVLNHEVLFASDAALLASEQTAGMVSANAFTPGLCEAKFKAAMVKMGRIGVKTSTDGEIRKNCWMVN